jgi:RNA 3'-phosphate cyclase
MGEAMIEIDGSQLEGGGSIVRISTALAALIQTPIRIYQIRAKRDKPGLRPQHLEGLRALAQLCEGKLEGDTLDSMEIKFYPGPIQARGINVNIKTAGGIGLVLQSLMIPAAFSNGTVFIDFKGGATDGPLAPPIDFMKNVTLPILKKMGYRGEVECVRRGHYPRGGGIVRARIEPVEKLQALRLTEPGDVIKISGLAHCVRLPSNIATRMAHAASTELIRAGYSKVQVKTEYYPPDKDPHIGPGAGITLWAETSGGAILGSSSLGRPGKPAEQVGREAAHALIKQLKTGCAVDSHLTDQLIPYMALAEGVSEITSAELTSHTLTNIALVEQILRVKFEVQGELGQTGKIRVEGRSQPKRPTKI